MANKNPPNKFAYYARNLGFAAAPYIWRENTKPQEELVKLVVPSLILVNESGIILQTWNGSNQSKEVRDRMGRQIVADTLLAHEIIQALPKR